MNKKILLSVVLLTSLVFTFNCVFANNNMVKNATNTVNDSINKTENTIEGATNTVKDAGNSAMNAAGDVANDVKGSVNSLTEDRTNNANTGNTANHNVNNNNNNIGIARTNNDGNNNYTATRTANEGTFLGMNSTTWTWMIIGLVAIAIIALVWSYSIQRDTVDSDFDD